MKIVFVIGQHLFQEQKVDTIADFNGNGMVLSMNNL